MTYYETEAAYRHGYKDGVAAEAERHKWHDLMKDPNDLPTKKGRYIVSYHPCYWENIQKDEISVGVDTFMGKTSWAKRKYQKVIAWKEIEPFIPNE